MKHISIFSAVGVVAVLAFTGCTPTASTKGKHVELGKPEKISISKNTLNGGKYIELTPKVETTLTLADLEVSEKRVIGTAEGFIASRDDLEREAVAQALLQKDGADLLVGTSFYYNTSERSITTSDGSVTVKRYLTVTVAGYPARYKNFRTYDSKTGTGFTINPDSNHNSAKVRNVAPVAVPVQIPSAPALRQTPHESTLGE